MQELLPEAVLLDVTEVCAAQQQTGLQLQDLPTETEASVSELFAEYLAGRGVQSSTVQGVLESFALLQDSAGASELPELREQDETAKGETKAAIS